ncbi:hypothetical protein GCM10022631_25180 [Deinococcus rubellus]
MRLSCWRGATSLGRLSEAGQKITVLAQSAGSGKVGDALTLKLNLGHAHTLSVGEGAG